MERRTYIYIFMLLILSSCSFSKVYETDDDSTPDRGTVGYVEQTTLMYFCGTSLGSFYSSNLSDVKSAIADGALGEGGRLFVYYPSYTSAELYELYESGGSYVKESVMTFESNESFDEERMVEVISMVKAQSESSSYNVVISGHGAGWVLSSHPYLKSVASSSSDINWEKEVVDGVTTRFMGSSSDGYMEVEELSEALSKSETKFGYILFDMCLMSNIETLYELKDLCDYVIASPCEVMGWGFPYQTVLPELFAEDGLNPDFAGVCEAYCNYYEQRTSYSSGAVAYCVTSELDGLAAAMKAINSAGVNSVDIGSLQCYEKLTYHVFCDLGEYVTAACDDAALVSNFESSMLKAFPQDGRFHTQSFYSALSGSTGWVDINYYSGVSTSAPSVKFRDEWAETSWVKATQSDESE
ncbi:MAG: clostripain-related cysteine peptidase [Rikenellaceae bacterium]